MKKKRLNARRAASQPEPTDSVEEPASSKRHPEPATAELQLRLGGVVLCESTLMNSPMLRHAQMLLSIIDGVKLSHDRLLELLRETMRQHSIAYRTRTDYVLRFLKQHPP